MSSAQGAKIPSFLQLSFDPQLLVAKGPATQSDQAHSRKRSHFQAGGTQLPPLPPQQAIISTATAVLPFPSELVANTQKQHQSHGSGVPEASSSQLQKQQKEQHPQPGQPQPQHQQQEHAVKAAAGRHAVGTFANAHAATMAAGMQCCCQHGQHGQQPWFNNGYHASEAASCQWYGCDNTYAGHYHNKQYFPQAAGFAPSSTDGSHGGSCSKGRGKGKGRKAASSEPNSEADDDYQAAAAAARPAAKRRKREAQPLDPDAQLLLLGFLSAVAGDSAMLSNSLIAAVHLEGQQLQQLQLTANMYGTAAGSAIAPVKRVDLLKSFQLAQSMAQTVRSRATLSLTWQLPLAFTTARSMLSMGGAYSLEDVVGDTAAECKAVLASFDFNRAGLRRSKVEPQVEFLAGMMRETLEQLLVQSGHWPDKAAAQKSKAAKYKSLPRSIVENKEPFAHKDWRKEPYEPRPYVEITSYAITTNVKSEELLLNWKLSTRRWDAAGDGWTVKHQDLSEQERNENEQRIVKQVRDRQGLVKGIDVLEIECWGMDCYTRRNVFDAVLEAGTFKHVSNQQQSPNQDQQHQQQQQLDQLQGQSQQQQSLLQQLQQQQSQVQVPCLQRQEDKQLQEQPEQPQRLQQQQGQKQFQQQPQDQQQQQPPHDDQQQEQRQRPSRRTLACSQSKDLLQDPALQPLQQVQEPRARLRRQLKPQVSNAAIQFQQQLVKLAEQQQQQALQQQTQSLEGPIQMQTSEKGVQQQQSAPHKPPSAQRAPHSQSSDVSANGSQHQAGCASAGEEQQQVRTAPERGSKPPKRNIGQADVTFDQAQVPAQQASKAGNEALPGEQDASPSPYSKAEQDAVHEWIDSVFLPAMNRSGADGWDMVKVATSIMQQADAAGNQVNATAAAAILKRFDSSGYPWFRLHPKGQGVIVMRPEGVAPFTLVEEYLGELHTGWRWFELQDAIKKVTQKDLPDFYNIALERPKDDPDGYDIMFVDAAFIGNYASRMSHSCTPNCQAVVVSAGNRLTVALYTIRQVAAGEELTFDYSCVTESEDEFKQAYCMCSTRHCRGSFLYYTGSKAYMQVMEAKHTFLDRQVLLLRSCSEPLTAADRACLHQAGLRGSALGRADVDINPKVPVWLQKWAALTLEFVALERQLLPLELQALPPPLTQSPQDSVAASVGVELNRLQNICISLDKAKYCLNQPGQNREAPLAMLSNAQVAEQLWNGDKSVAKRAVKAAAAAMLDEQDAATVAAATTAAEYGGAAALVQYSHPVLAAMLNQVCAQVEGAAAARIALKRLVSQLRELDVLMGGGHTCAADILHLYAATQVWFAANRNYTSFSSPPLQLHEDLISLHGGLDTSGAHDSKCNKLKRTSSSSGSGGCQLKGHITATSAATTAAAPTATVAATAAAAATGGATAAAAATGADGASISDGTQHDPDHDSADDGTRTAKGPSRQSSGQGDGGSFVPAWQPMKDISRKILEKRYSPFYIWAQLSAWFKQNVYEPTASLAADRRGTISLPDIESCYTTNHRYDAKERAKLITHIAKQPEKPWTSASWSFRNDAKVYGSPMFDAFWGEVMQKLPRSALLTQLIEELQAAAVPSSLRTTAPAMAAAATGNGGKAAKAKGKRMFKAGSSSGRA